MILSFFEWFAKAATFPGTTAFLLGTTIDLKKTGIDQSTNDEYWWVTRTTTAFTGTSTNLSIDLLSSDTSPTTTWTSPTVHVTGTVYAAIANVPAVGADWLAVQLPRGTYKRYLGLRANYATAAPSTGAVDSFLVPQYRAGQILPQGIVGA